jgi:signal transduction histidine kinase
MLAGCFFLVGLGLAPLRRMSDAVSRISEKNMSLQLKSSQMPTELRTIADRLSQTLDMLKKAFAREKQAAADISHELRTPLAALLTTIEVGLRRPRTVEEYGDLLKDCHAIGQQMTLLVERLLTLARIDAGVATIREQEIDVAALANQCVGLVRPLAEARAVQMQLNCQAPSRMATDPDKLREVLTNLLHNAVEYNKPNGKIDVTVERQNGTLTLDVRDTGIGRAPKALAHVFERFFRADESRHADGLHAGVGLSIVKGYVELMGGTIIVESKEGEGSIFRVQLPLR